MKSAHSMDTNLVATFRKPDVQGGEGPWVSEGNVVRSLYPYSQTAAATSSTASPARPLRVISSAAKPKLSGILVGGLLLLGALLAILVLNVLVSAQQYELVSLRQEHTNLQKGNEELRQREEVLRSPQNLAAQARDLGMVVPGTIGQINLESGEISGEPRPVDRKEAPKVLIPQAQIPEQQNTSSQTAHTGENATPEEETIPSPRQRTPR